MQHPEYACSSITIGRELPAGSGFLARGDGKPGIQVGPETDQCVDREGGGVLRAFGIYSGENGGR
ncbi:hypothetical protein Gotur_002516 [Gossypium turneri]